VNQRLRCSTFIHQASVSFPLAPIRVASARKSDQYCHRTPKKSDLTNYGRTVIVAGLARKGREWISKYMNHPFTAQCYSMVTSVALSVHCGKFVNVNSLADRDKGRQVTCTTHRSLLVTWMTHKGRQVTCTTHRSRLVTCTTQRSSHLQIDTEVVKSPVRHSKVIKSPADRNRGQVTCMSHKGRQVTCR